MDLEILEKINRSSLRFLQPLTPEATYAAILDEAIKLVKGDAGFLALVEGDDVNIKYASSVVFSSMKVRKKGFSYKSYSERRAFVVHIEKFRNVHPELVKEGIQSTIFIPLSNKGKSIGLMNIMSKKRATRFSNKELSILKLFGSMASMAIRKTQLYSEVKSALETRDLFLSMAAHEFRTPITTISGYAQLLRNKVKQDSTEKRWIEEIYKETHRLTRLVNELLEVNRIRMGHFQYIFLECNIDEILEKVIEGFKVTHPKRQVIYNNRVSEKDSIIIGDKDKLTQVLINVLDNANKFSPPNETIEVDLIRSDDLIIRVKDYGHGIVQQDLDKVFEGFYRGLNNVKEGMGLGLYLSYKIVKVHKGEIRIKSKVNKGTVIEIRFPKTRIKRF